jgi:hypothetical protein
MLARKRFLKKNGIHIMTPERGEDRLLAVDPTASDQDLDLGTRVDQNGQTTYHVICSDRRFGVFLEKIYDKDHKLIRLQKRSRDSRSETLFDTRSGAVTHIFETSTLPDGDTLTKNTIYWDSEKSSEDVIVVAPNGELVRRVEREVVGLRTIFQGQTEYNSDGTPATTVNHSMDQATGNVIHREQIQWLSEQQRSLTEDFFFDEVGNLVKYNKVLYNANSGPLIEELQTYDPSNHAVLKREIKGYSSSGRQNCIDTLTYDPDGQISERHSTFFDEQGNTIGSRDCV